MQKREGGEATSAEGDEEMLSCGPGDGSGPQVPGCSSPGWKGKEKDPHTHPPPVSLEGVLTQGNLVQTFTLRIARESTCVC